jgi:hypothetical protein
LARLIKAYLPGSLLLTAGLLPLIGLAYCGLLAWLFAAHWSNLLARLIMAYLPGYLLLTTGFLWLIGLANCSLLTWLIMAYLPGSLLLPNLA